MRDKTVTGTLTHFIRAARVLSKQNNPLRNMLTRICLIVAILAGLAVGALNFIKVKEKITTLQTTLKTTEDTLATTQGTLRTAESNLKKATSDLATTKQQRDSAVAERDKANTDKIAAEKKMQKAVDDLTASTTALKDAQSKLGAYEASGLTPAQAMNASKQIKDLQATITGMGEENKIIANKLRKALADLALLKDPDMRPFLPATLQGKVVVFDPKWDFVILNVGEDQGVVENGELLVNRNGKLIAKVIVRNVQKDRCIANIVPGWKLANETIVEGDSVIPAKPAST
jgi:Tfp pilus assembly protein PilE